MARGFTVPTTFTAVDKVSGTINKMIGANSRFERSMRNTSRQMLSISKKSAMFGLAVATPLGLAANEAIKFEESMANVSTLIDSSVEDIGKMGESVLKLSESLPVPINELTASLYDVRSAGIAVDDQFKVLEASAKLSAGGLSSVEEATNITTSAYNAFASEGLKASEITDILFKTVKAGKTTVSELAQAFGATAPIVQSAGVKLADFQAATAAITTLGTPAAQAQNQLRASITALQKPSAEMQKVFKSLGVTTDKELIQKSGSLVNAYSDINAEIQKLGLNTAKTWRSTEALAAVTSLTGSTNKAYVDTLVSMTDGVNALDEAYQKQSKTGKASLQLAKNQFQSIAITIGNELLPIMNDLLKSATPLIKSFAGWVRNNRPLVGTILKITGAVAGLSFGLSAVTGVIGGVTKALSLLGGPVTIAIAGATALYAAYDTLSSVYMRGTRTIELGESVRNRAIQNTIDQQVEVDLLFKSLRKATAGSDDYNKVLTKIEAIQPGITKQYDLQAGAIENINKAEKALTESIIKRAEAEARAQILKETVTAKIRAEQEGPGFMDKALEFAQRQALAVGTFGLSEVTGLGEKTVLTADEINADRIAGLEEDAQILASEQEQAINPKKTFFSRMSETIKEKVEIVINNKSDSEVSTNSSNLAMPVTTNTNG